MSRLRKDKIMSISMGSGGGGTDDMLTGGGGFDALRGLKEKLSAFVRPATKGSPSSACIE